MAGTRRTDRDTSRRSLRGAFGTAQGRSDRSTVSNEEPLQDLRRPRVRQRSANRTTWTQEVSALPQLRLPRGIRLTRRGRVVFHGVYLALLAFATSIVADIPPTPSVQAAVRPVAAAKPHSKVIPWSVDRSQSYARLAVRLQGWSTTEYRCLVRLWTKESNWRHQARNKKPVMQIRDGKKVWLHAGGIPQILGLDPKLHPVTQIDRGIDYIKSRYGSPCESWRFWTRNGWY